MIKTIKQAISIIGSDLSKPSKMPGYGWGLSPDDCITGNILRQIEGSVCSMCYGKKGNYNYDNVKKCHERRLVGLNHPQWIEAMIFLIRKRSKLPYFRWFDVGDIQSVNHLNKIVKVCQETKEINHWLPTKEKGLVASFLSRKNFPDNLCVRLSHPKIGEYYKRTSLNTSSVSSGYGHKCKATYNKYKTCNEARCKRCWNKNVKNIDYKKH